PPELIRTLAGNRASVLLDGYLHRGIFALRDRKRLAHRLDALARDLQLVVARRQLDRLARPREGLSVDLDFYLSCRIPQIALDLPLSCFRVLVCQPPVRAVPPRPQQDDRDEGPAPAKASPWRRRLRLEYRGDTARPLDDERFRVVLAPRCAR